MRYLVDLLWLFVLIGLGTALVVMFVNSQLPKEDK
jgi:hypothetical protein